MFKNIWTVALVLGLVIFGFTAPFLAASSAGDRAERESAREKKIKWDKVPAVVKSAIEKRVAERGGKITEIVKKTEDGKVYYEFEVKKDGGELDYRVAPDGMFLGVEDDEGNITGSEEGQTPEPSWADSFSVDPRNFSSTGKNDYFILDPGFQLVLRGEEDGESVELIVTVLNETKKVGGVETRIVEERESKGKELVEVSRNYFSIDKTTRSVYYFGEDVDNYEDGKIVNHDGSWLAGKNGARYGLAMPGKIVVGDRYYQEIAPKIAMDRAEILSVSVTLKTPAGKFENCLKTQESTAINPSEKEFKHYAPGIGLIQDEDLRLVEYGVKGR